MLTPAGCQSRRERLWTSVPAEIEWLLIADPRHVHYLANFWVNPISFSAGERGLLLLERGGEATLLADNFTIRSAVSEPHVERVINQKWYDHRHAVINRDHALLTALSSVAGQLAKRRGFVETEALPVAAAEIVGEMPPQQVLSDGTTLGTIIRQLRRKKDPDELDLIRQAMAATDAGQARAREVIRAGISEWELYAEVQAAAQNLLQRPAIVYGDFRAVNAKVPKAGGLPTNYRLQPGDLFILDYGVVVEGYRSDFTNTLAVGEPTSGQKRLFDLCVAAMKSGEQSLRAGVTGQAVWSAVAEPFREAGMDKFFPHHAGHGIGLGHPEPPVLVAESDDVLLAGDVVTLEPGLYVEGTGGVRIEHNYLITENGFEQLSHHVISLT